MATLTTRKTIKLNDVMPEWLTGKGIFTALSNFNVPWKNDITASLLDIEYHGNHAGSKNVSPVVNRILQADETETLSDVRVATLANMIYSINSVRWSRLWETLDADYNILNNYDMTETESTGVETENNITNTGTVGHSTSETETGTNSGTDNAKRYAFNSTSDVNTAKTETSGSASVTTTGTDTRTDNTAEHGTGTREESRTLTRSGNIGVTSSQMMLTQEREVNIWNIFYSVIFPDVDKVLTIATYSDDVIYNGNVSSGGGTSSAILAKLDEIDAKVDTINTNTRGINLNIEQLRASTFNKIDGDTASINLSIEQLRTSTFNAIDGVTSRSY